MISQIFFNLYILDSFHVVIFNVYKEQY